MVVSRLGIINIGFVVFVFCCLYDRRRNKKKKKEKKKLVLFLIYYNAHVNVPRTSNRPSDDRLPCASNLLRVAALTAMATLLKSSVLRVKRHG